MVLSLNWIKILNNIYFSNIKKCFKAVEYSTPCSMPMVVINRLELYWNEVSLGYMRNDKENPIMRFRCWGLNCTCMITTQLIYVKSDSW